MLRRFSHLRGLILFGLAVAAVVAWLLTRDTTGLADYSTARQQTWISPERIAYANEMNSKVEALERELDEVVLELSRIKFRPKDPRQELASSLRDLRRELRASLTTTNQAPNDQFEAAKAQLEASLSAATAAVKAARERGKSQ